MKQKKEFLIDALHIFILVSLVLSKPLYVLSSNAEFFVAHSAGPLDIVLLVLILFILLPALLVFVQMLAGLSGRRFRKGLHFFMVASLLTVIALTMLKGIIGFPGVILLTGAVILGIAVTVAYIRFIPVRHFLTFLSPAILLFPGLFLFNSQVTKIVLPEKEPSAVKVKIDNPVPVVMVIFDEFPITSLMDERRLIDPVRYPNFSALAKDSYWFRNATSVHESTHYAVPAILTGNYPELSKLPTVTDYPKNMFTLLGKTYDMEVYEPLTQLCPEQLCEKSTTWEALAERMKSLLTDMTFIYLHVLLPGDFTKELPVITRSWKNFTKSTVGFRNNQTNNTDFIESLGNLFKTTWNEEIKKKDRSEVFRQFIRTIQATDRPTLYFQHIYLPHIPWGYLPSGNKYSVIEDKINGLNFKNNWWDDNDLFVTEGYQRHLLQVGFVDKLLGELIDKLKAVGMYDNALIIITADHGVSFKPNDSIRGVSKTNYQDIMPIPLFIKVPNQRSGIITDHNVETIDILPTIADVLNISIPWPVDGRSVFDTSLPERTEKVIFRKQTAEDRLVFEPYLDAKYETLDRMLDLFGSGTTKPDGLFKIGPHNELVGRNVSEIGVTGQADVYIQFDRPFLFDNVDLSAFIPAQITGRVLQNMGTSEPLALAVAVNGVISAVSQPYLNKKKEMEFSAIAPENAFRSGKNKVEVFLVAKNNSRLVLSNTKNKIVETYTLTSPTSPEFITSSSGASIPVTSDVLKGYLDLAEIKGDNVLFFGWAADLKEFRPADTIAIFVNGKFLYLGCCNQDRPDLVKAYKNSDMLRAGFKFNIPLSLFKDIDNSEVRIFAVSKKGVATELNYPKGYKWGRK